LLHLIALNDTRARGRTPLDEGSARCGDIYLTQRSQETDIHARSGIRILNPSMRAGADPRLRPSCRRCFCAQLTLVDLRTTTSAGGGSGPVTTMGPSSGFQIPLWWVFLCPVST
jgi:hypothetical protein